MTFLYVMIFIYIALILKFVYIVLISVCQKIVQCLGHRVVPSSDFFNKNFGIIK